MNSPCNVLSDASVSVVWPRLELLLAKFAQGAAAGAAAFGDEVQEAGVAGGALECGEAVWVGASEGAVAVGASAAVAGSGVVVEGGDGISW